MYIVSEVVNIHVGFFAVPVMNVMCLRMLVICSISGDVRCEWSQCFK